MKEIEELILPEEVLYTEDHEWARVEGDTVSVGITDYAQDQLGEIVFAELPQVGDRFERRQQFGTIESVKAVVEVYMPVSGEVVALNDSLSDSPEFINQAPYEKGYMISVRVEDPGELDQLMNKEKYLEMLKGMEK